MQEMNRLHWANELACYDHPIKDQQQESNDSHRFYIQSHTGILYRRRSVSGRRLFSTA